MHTLLCKINIRSKSELHTALAYTQHQTENCCDDSLVKQSQRETTNRIYWDTDHKTPIYGL